MKQMNVFPECNVDTNLVGFILGVMLSIRALVMKWLRL